MRRVPPSTVIREEIDYLLSRGLDQEANLLSELAELSLCYLVQQGLEQEQTDSLGRGHYERRSEGEQQTRYRNGYEDTRLKTAEGAVPRQGPGGARLKEPLSLETHGVSGRQLRGLGTATQRSWSALS